MHAESTTLADARNLYGYDVVQEAELRDASDYFEEAARRVNDQRRQLEAAPRFTAAHHGVASRKRPG